MNGHEVSVALAPTTRHLNPQEPWTQNLPWSDGQLLQCTRGLRTRKRREERTEGDSVGTMRSSCLCRNYSCTCMLCDLQAQILQQACCRSRSPLCYAQSCFANAWRYLEKALRANLRHTIGRHACPMQVLISPL